MGRVKIIISLFIREAPSITVHHLLLVLRALIESERRKKKKTEKHEALNYDEFTPDESDRFKTRWNRVGDIETAAV